MPDPIRLAVTGAAGRMGRRIIALSAAMENIQVIAALERGMCFPLPTCREET